MVILEKTLILIPSRYQSSRFPGKSLAKLSSQKENGEPYRLVEAVYANCLETGCDVAVVTDSDAIETYLKNNGVKVLRVDDEVESGTERIALAYQRYRKKNYDFIINVQGDEPLLKSSDILKLLNFHQSSHFDITTLVKPYQDSGEIENANIIKVAMGHQGCCLYFSRSAIPFAREKRKFWYQHIGVYCYRALALEKFVDLEISSLEKTECLEQLRALENGMTIGAIETKANLMGIDTPEQLDELNLLLTKGRV